MIIILLTFSYISSNLFNITVLYIHDNKIEDAFFLCKLYFLKLIIVKNNTKMSNIQVDHMGSMSYFRLAHESRN